MTAAADITVKKADETTNIVWSLVTASAGEQGPALWISNTASGTKGQRPTFSIGSRQSGDRVSRRLDFKVTFPSVYTDADSSLTQVRATAVMNVSCVVPQTMLDADISEFAHQAMNLLASAAGKAALVDGYAPT